MLDLRFVRENPDIVKQNIKINSRTASCRWWTKSISLDTEARANRRKPMI